MAAGMRDAVAAAKARVEAARAECREAWRRACHASSADTQEQLDMFEAAENEKKEALRALRALERGILGIGGAEAASAGIDASFRTGVEYSAGLWAGGSLARAGLVAATGDAALAELGTQLERAGLSSYSSSTAGVRPMASGVGGVSSYTGTGSGGTSKPHTMRVAVPPAPTPKPKPVRLTALPAPSDASSAPRKKMTDAEFEALERRLFPSSHRFF